MAERQVYAGTSGAGGTALGRIWRADRPLSTGDGASVPVAAAFVAVAEDLAASAHRLRQEGRDEPADIVETTLLIAQDPDLRDLVEQALAAGVAAHVAVRDSAEHHAGILAGLPDRSWRRAPPTYGRWAAASSRRWTARVRPRHPGPSWSWPTR